MPNNTEIRNVTKSTLSLAPMSAPKNRTHFDTRDLPVLEIDLRRIARGTWFDQVERNRVGYCFSCDLIGLLYSALHHRESIDQFLACFLAKGFSEWALKSRILVGVAVVGNQFEIYLVSKRAVAPGWVYKLPAFISAGSNYFCSSELAWIGYWDAARYHRLYETSCMARPWWVRYFAEGSRWVPSVVPKPAEDYIGTFRRGWSTFKIPSTPDFCFDETGVCQSHVKFVNGLE